MERCIIKDLGKRDCVDIIEKVCEVKLNGEESIEDIINGIFGSLMGGELVKGIFGLGDEDFEKWSCEGWEGVKEKIEGVINEIKEN